MAEQGKTYRLKGLVCTNPDEIGVEKRWEQREIEFKAIDNEDARRIEKERYSEWFNRELKVKTD